MDRLLTESDKNLSDEFCSALGAAIRGVLVLLRAGICTSTQSIEREIGLSANLPSLFESRLFC